MRALRYVAVLVIAGSTLASGSAFAANVCKSEKLSCATNMPVGGFCQCSSQGQTEDGTVVDQQPAPTQGTTAPKQ